MAGIGVAANKVVRNLPRAEGPTITLDDLLGRLDEIRWGKDAGFWDGVATRKTPKGVTTVAGPKEVGYAVAEAIEGSNPVSSAQIRGHAAAPAQPMLDSAGEVPIVPEMPAEPTEMVTNTA